MKKKFALLALILALVCTLCLAFTACDNTPDPDPKPTPTPTPATEAKYTGLFTYTRNVEGHVNYNDMVLKDDGSFYLVTFMATNVVGTYEYNSDKTKITFDAENDDNYDGTYNVEVNDGVVTIKEYKTFYYDGTLYADDYVYNTVRTKPAEPKIEIVTFYVEADPDAYLKLFTGKKYELKTTTASTTTAILSSGDYTENKSGNTTTYTLKDTLNGDNATYTFTSTYTEEDGYSNLKLTGTGIAEAGVEFVYEKPLQLKLAGKVTTDNGEESVEVICYKDNSVDVIFTTFGGACKATGTWANDAMYNLVITLDGGDQLDWVDAENDKLTFALDASYKYYGVVKINAEVMTGVVVEYTVNVAETAAPVVEKEAQLKLGGTATVASGAETVEIICYKDNTVEVVFTTYTSPCKATGTWANDAMYNLVITLNGGDQLAWVDAENDTLTFGMNAAYRYGGDIKINAEVAPGMVVEYTVTVAETFNAAMPID